MACPGSPFTFHFRIQFDKTLSRSSSLQAADAVLDFFLDGQLPADLFVTKTTTLQDVCESSIETLSVSFKSARNAVLQYSRSVKRASTHTSRKGRRRMLGGGIRRMFAVVSMRGTAGMRAIKTHQVSGRLQTLLAQNGTSVSVISSVQKGPARLPNLKAGAKAVSVSQVNLPAPTHTFQAYAASPTFKFFIPIILADSDFTGDLIPDVVASEDNAVLQPTQYRVTAVYRSSRKEGDWTQLTGREKRMFAFKTLRRDKQVRLRLNMKVSPFYWRLRGQKDRSKSPKTLQAMREFLSQQGLKLSAGNDYSSTGGERGPRFLKWAQGNVNQSAALLDDETAFHTDNYAAADYAQDYAIIFRSRSSSAPLRMDVTVIPLVIRNRQASGSLSPAKSRVCLPGNAAQGLSNVGSGIPERLSEQSACPMFRERTASPSNVLDDGSFEGLHPEESEWVKQRSLKTGPKLAAFIDKHLFPMIYSTPPNLKLAIAVSGGGKRSLYNAAGVTSGLAQAGVLDLATWMAGSSGGSWLVGGVYGASLEEEALVDPGSYIEERLTDVSKSIFDGTFCANDVLTNFGVNGVASLPVAPFASQPSAAATSASILCQSELKFQSPGIKPTQLGSSALAEYWGRALGYQLLGTSSLDGGVGVTMSGLLEHGLLAEHQAPLPLIILQNGQGAEPFLWEVSPFDVGVHKGDVHVSYPTALLGTDLSDASKRCTTKLDQLSWLMGVSGWIFPLALEYAGGTLQSLVCGEAGSACQPVSISNPFFGHTGPSQAAVEGASQGLFSSIEAPMWDGSATFNNPAWPFVTPTRMADVMIVIDSGGAEGAEETDPPLSRAPLANCASDAATRCTSNTFYELSGPLNGRCCSACSPLLDFSCWPTPNPSMNDLFRLSAYSDEHTLPADIPQPGFEDPKHATQVSFFGCRQPNVTAIVYIPNRVVSSGKSGFTGLRGALEFNELFGIPADPLTAPEIRDILRNGEDQVGQMDFKKCLACLFAASLPEQDRENFWTVTRECTACLETYCQA